MAGTEPEMVLRTMAAEYNARDPRDGGRAFVEDVVRRLRTASSTERDEVITTLLDLVARRDPLLATAALEVLVEEGGRSAGERLVQIFDASGDDAERDQLALALARLAYPQARDRVLAHILDGVFEEGDRSHRPTTLAFAARNGDDTFLETAARLFVWLLRSPARAYQAANLTPLYVRQLASDSVQRLRRFVELVYLADRATGEKVVDLILAYVHEKFAEQELDERTLGAVRAEVSDWRRSRA